MYYSHPHDDEAYDAAEHSACQAEDEDGPCEGCFEDCDGCEHDDDNYDDTPYWEREESEFADPGGNSALRASSRSNPRNLPCPTCGTPNVLTPADKARHYQCDACADRAESGWGY